MIYTFNGIKVDSSNFQLIKDEQKLDIEPKVFNLIVFLITQRNRLVTRSEIHKNVWQGRVVSDSSISNHIKIARKVLGDDGKKQEVIATVHGRGYQFVADIIEIDNEKNKANNLKSYLTILLAISFLFFGFYYFNNTENYDTNTKLIEEQLDQSIAVLAFKDLSPKTDQVYFSEGLSEELINLLAQIPELKVASRTSSFSFKDRNKTIQEIGKELGVTTVLEGSVRKSEEKLRVTVQLIKVSDGAHLWSHNYDLNMGDVFNIQDQIASAVTDQLRIKLSKELKKATVVNEHAYTLYLQAIYLLKENTEDSIRKSLDLIAQSISKDSTYAPAWAAYSRIMYTVAIYSYKKENKATFLLAKHAAGKSIELDKNYARGYGQLALINLAEWDLISAKRNIEKAMELDVNNSSIIGVYAYYLQLSGNLKECIVQLKRAIKLDPLFDVHHLNLGITYLLLLKLDDAEDSFKMYGYLHPNAVAHHAMMAHVYLLQGKTEQALVEADQEVNEYWKQSTLAFVQYSLGNSKKADELMQSYIEVYGENVPAHIASLYAYRGDLDKAFKWLEKSLAKHDAGLLHVINFQSLRNLWKDKRWLPFVKKLKLPYDHWLLKNN